MSETKWTSGPWRARQFDWRGNPVEHKFYISGDEYDDYDEPENADPYGDSCKLVCTAVAIVEGNATSGEVTAANARLIAAAPAMAEAIQVQLEAQDRWRRASRKCQVFCDDSDDAAELAGALNQLDESAKAIRAALALAEQGPPAGDGRPSGDPT